MTITANFYRTHGNLLVTNNNRYRYYFLLEKDNYKVTSIKDMPVGQQYTYQIKVAAIVDIEFSHSVYSNSGEGPSTTIYYYGMTFTPDVKAVATKGVYRFTMPSSDVIVSINNNIIYTW